MALFCTAWPLGALASSDAPLGVGTFGSIRMLFLDMPLADARAGSGEWGLDALDLRWWTANNWSVPTTLTRDDRNVDVQTDEQSDVLALSLRFPWARRPSDPSGSLGDWPWAARFTTTLEFRLIEHWGGWSDGFIEGWHGLIGSTNFERQRHPPYAINLFLREPAGTTAFALTTPRLAIGDVAVRTQFLLAEGGVSTRSTSRSQWGVSLRADLKVPLGSLESLGGSGGWDAGLGLAGTIELNRWLTGHAMVTASTWSGLPSGFPLQPRNLHWSAEFSLAAQLWGLTFLLEDRLVSSLFEDGWSFVPSKSGGLNASATYALLRVQNQISWGVRWNQFTIWMSEDWTPGSNPASKVHWFYNSNQPDFVIGISYVTSP